MKKNETIAQVKKTPVGNKNSSAIKAAPQAKPVEENAADRIIASVKKAEHPTTKVATKRTGMTAATVLTITRLALLPLIMFFYLSGSVFTKVEFLFEYGKLIAMILFTIAAITDFLDGYIARKHNQVTDLGKLLDPIADKLLTLLGFVLIVTDVTLIGSGNLLPIWFAVLIIFIATTRDYIVNVLRQLAADKGKIYAANWSGKIKTTVQYVGLAILMFFAFNIASGHSVFTVGNAEDVFGYICIFLMSLATILSIYSTIDYTIKYKQLVKK